MLAPIQLSARGLEPLGTTSPRPFIGRICENPGDPEPARGTEILLVREPRKDLPPGFRAYFVADRTVTPEGRNDVYVLGPKHQYLAGGDVVRVEPSRRTLFTFYRRASPMNSLLVTERCDNYCVMCSQPPKERDDSWRLEELRSVVPLISPEAVELTITGGEPALLGAGLADLLRLMRDHLPRTAAHVLSNGRAFRDPGFARSLGEIDHPDLMLGIPLYSDLPEEHDYVVQASGAFDETVLGILNLKRARVPVEIRFVIHAETYHRLPEFAAFVSRNLRFIDHIALMGLEPIGFARANLDQLWIDPVDYQAELAAAVHTLRRAGIRTSIYNHQLCTIPNSLRPLAKRSISDWKNVYFPECDGCTQRESCGGFFASSDVRRSRGILASRQ